MSTNRSIAIVGSGAMGGYYGARLAAAGFAVHFLLRSDFEAVREKGWTVKSRDGDFVVRPDRIRVYRDSAEMPNVDLVVITLKTTGNGELRRLVAPLVGEKTVLLTLQNGLGNEDELARHFGAGRVIGGVAFVCINRVGPGVIDHSSHGLIHVGDFSHSGGPTERIEEIAADFRSAKIRCQAIGDLISARWQKLVWNVPFNGLGAVLDMTTDRVLASEAGRGMVEALMREVGDGAAAQGLTMPAGIIEKQIGRTPEMGAYASSMQIDRQQGRPMEIEAILGEPMRRTNAAGVTTPNLAALYRMARMVDGEQRASV
ncbi:MAG TPA: putative 2-dehydropantoate 2-reductase [Tepidisphaeraceae bacterium]|nr:putative 2-dehydropantoate 2-reductase [Tepidisphaeraceae bacterium]